MLLGTGTHPLCAFTFMPPHQCCLTAYLGAFLLGRALPPGLAAFQTSETTQGHRSRVFARIHSFGQGLGIRHVLTRSLVHNGLSKLAEVPTFRFSRAVSHHRKGTKRMEICQGKSESGKIKLTHYRNATRSCMIDPAWQVYPSIEGRSGHPPTNWLLRSVHVEKGWLGTRLSPGRLPPTVPQSKSSSASTSAAL